MLPSALGGALVRHRPQTYPQLATGVSLGWSKESGYCPLTQSYAPPLPPPETEITHRVVLGAISTGSLSSRPDNKELVINQPRSRVSKIPMGPATERDAAGIGTVCMVWVVLGYSINRKADKLRLRLYRKSRSSLWFSLELFHSFGIDIVPLPRSLAANNVTLDPPRRPRSPLPPSPLSQLVEPFKHLCHQSAYTMSTCIEQALFTA